MNTFFKYIIGSSTYHVITARPAWFAGELMSNFSDAVFNVSVCDDNSFDFSCMSYAVRRILKSEILNGAEVIKSSEVGIPHFAKKHVKRYGLIVGAVLCALIVYLQSFVVWELEISGNNKISDDEIKSTLASLGFSEGSFILPSELSELQNRFILSESRISWIAINMSGTVAFVEVKERDVKEDLQEKPSMSGIVSSRDCIIELSQVTCGTSLVNIGDTVQKGQMLISPLAIGKDGNEYLVGAYGTVLARTYEEFSVQVPYYRQSASFTGRKSSAYTFSFLGKELSFDVLSFEKFDKYIRTVKTEKVKLLQKAELPIKMTKQEKLEYVLCEEIITPQQARKVAFGKMYSKISQALPEAEILSTTFSESEESDCFVLRCRVECIRDVAMRIDSEKE